MRINGLPPLTDEEKLRCTDKEKLILSHIGLVYYHVDKLVRRYPTLVNYKNELESVGLMTVVEVVNKDIFFDNITGYIVKRLHGALLDAMAIKPIIGKGKGKKAPKSYSLGNLLDREKGDNDYNETLEAIYSVCTGPFDFEIIKGRLAGETDKQIAERLGLSRLQVFRTRKSIQKCYQEKYDE